MLTRKRRQKMLLYIPFGPREAYDKLGQSGSAQLGNRSESKIFAKALKEGKGNTHHDFRIKHHQGTT